MFFLSNVLYGFVLSFAYFEDQIRVMANVILRLLHASMDLENRYALLWRIVLCYDLISCSGVLRDLN